MTPAAPTHDASTQATLSKILSADVSSYAVALPLATSVQADVDAHAIALPERLAKAIASRKAEFIAGRYCALKSLSAAGLAFAPRSSPRIDIGPDREPRWPAGWTGSIAHTHGVAAAAVARASTHRGLGLDLEALVGEDRSTELRQMIMTDAEQDRLTSRLGLGAPIEASVAFTLAFSAKESLYKCLRPLCGGFFGFHAAEIRSADLTTGRFEIALTEDIGGGFGPGWSIAGRCGQAEGRLMTAIELRSST